MSEPEWRQLMWGLSEIESGLQMTDLPLSEIENSFAERESSLSATEKRLTETESRLDSRESELNERDADLRKRGKLYDSIDQEIAGIQEDHQKAIEAGARKLRTWRWATAIGSAGTGISTGIAALQAEKPVAAGGCALGGLLLAIITAPKNR
jgi:septal ring factor EnvC (AmiA/AmiB activator)